MRDIMMPNLVPPDLIPNWIPGERTLDSTPLGWQGLSLKGYRYERQEVEIPPMRDYMMVVYQGAPATMRRRSGGRWQTEHVECGVVSLLTRGERSTWQWSREIDVKHIYLSHDALETTARQVFDIKPDRIDIDDKVRSEDPAIPMYLRMLEQELAEGGVGQALLIDTIRTQLAVHLLRKYARVELRKSTEGKFRETERRMLIDFIECRLSENFSLDDLSGCVSLSAYHFSRKFKADFGATPHTFVVQKRIERAKRLLHSRILPIKVIANECGFSDQSHFGRTFHKIVGVTPKEFQRGIF
jgi:AraC family transcriptional regulator